MKTFKKPQTILEHAKDDIEAGHWCRGTLAQYGKQNGDVISEEDLFPEIVADSEQAGQKISFFEKPMGCALGLVSMYAGLGEDMTVIDEDGKKKTFFLPNYPHFADGEGVTRALRALYHAIPAKQRYFDDPSATEDEIIESIHKYNDQATMGVKRAAKWFDRALATL